PLAADAGENRLDRIVDRDLLDLDPSESPAVKPQIVQTAAVSSSRFLAADDHLSRVFDGTGQAVFQDLDLGEFAVEIDFHPGSFARSVVGYAQMLPLAVVERILYADHDRALGPLGGHPNGQWRGPTLNVDQVRLFESELKTAPRFLVLDLLECIAAELADAR